VKIRRWLAGGLLLAALGTIARPSEAVVVERIVAVIGEKAILLSDLRRRARPFLVRLYASIPQGPQRAAAESKVYSQLIERMVDEELESLAATRQGTRVSAEEVDKALRRIARVSGQPLSKLIADVEKSTGMTETEYRLDVRRQVLEGKLLNRFIANQRITEQELQGMYELIRKKEQELLLYNPGWIVLRLGKTPSAEFLTQRIAEANDIVARLEAGEKFADLAGELSEDAATSTKGGDLGIRVPSSSPKALEGKYSQLHRSLERKAAALDIDQIAAPFRFKDAIVVMTIISRQPSRYPSIDAVRAELTERVRGEKLQKVKDKWLEDLRQRTHVDVRM
jgi:peptidyl-prolyl cis-trans isomerase SurA